MAGSQPSASASHSVHIKMEVEEPSGIMVIDLEDEDSDSGDSRIEAALTDEEEKGEEAPVIGREPDPVAIPGNPVIILEGNNSRQAEGDLAAANKIIELQRNQLDEQRSQLDRLRHQVDDAELEQYRLSVIADYEIDKIRKKYCEERKKRVETQDKLVTIIRESPRMLPIQAPPPSAPSRGNLVGLEDIKVDTFDEEEDVEVVLLDDADDEPVSRSKPSTSGQTLYRNPLFRASEGSPRPGNSQQIQNDSLLPKAPRRPEVNRMRPQIQHTRSRLAPTMRTMSNRQAASQQRQLASKRVPQSRPIIPIPPAPGFAPQPHFNCDVCDLQFFKLCLLRRHKQQHQHYGMNDEKLKGFGCADCGLILPTWKMLMGHRINIHGTKLGNPGLRRKNWGGDPTLTRNNCKESSSSDQSTESTTQTTATLPAPALSDEEEPAPSSLSTQLSATIRSGRVVRAPARLVDYSDNGDCTSDAEDSVDEMNEETDASEATEFLPPKHIRTKRVWLPTVAIREDEVADGNSGAPCADNEMDETAVFTILKTEPAENVEAEPSPPILTPEEPLVRRTRRIMKRKLASNRGPRRREINNNGSTKHNLVGPDPKLDNADYHCICGKKYTKRPSFLIHLKHKTGPKPFRCYLCPKRFSSHQILKIHVFRYHGEDYEPDSKYACGKCGQRGLKDIKALQEHRLTAHQE